MAPLLVVTVINLIGSAFYRYFGAQLYALGSAS